MRSIPTRLEVSSFSLWECMKFTLLNENAVVYMKFVGLAAGDAFFTFIATSNF